MTPTPQEYSKSEQEVIGEVRDGERIVISGMSGLYPKSHNIKELSDMLYDKRSPISEDNSRWKFIHPEVSKYAGNIPELQRFDAQFFKVHYRLGNCIDPMGRKLLEQSYNAIYDAGINPESLSGQKIGVFIGSCFSETDKSCFYDTSSTSGFGITGCCRAMFAHRISYWLNAKGPSMTLDESCCSSAAALEQAYLAITEGHCVAAIVGASCLCLHPQSSIHYSRIMKHSNDGKIRSFDANGSGPVKSETINVLFLQKAKDALRVYSDVVHVKTQYIGLLQGETGPMFGFLRDHDATVNFMKKFYEEAKVPPRAIEYVEAYGCAIPEVDKAELEAIDKVFCEKKESPLLVGSVMSNIGYVESGTSIAGVTKVLLGFHTGKLASNLHCENPRQDVEAIRDGRIKIVTEHEDCSYSYAAINGYSISGANSHILLQGHYKPKDLSRYKSDIPHLVTISARQDTTVQKIFENFKSRDIDPEELALWRNIHGSSISGHLGRGFVILDTNEEQKTVSRAERAEYFDGARRPLWFVYSGMGSQWAGMGTQLMRIPIFAAAIEKCRQTLEPKGIDIVHIITSNDDKIFDNILNSFVGIAAIQIGLTDVLHELGLVPDGIIGHSVGELGCAYADGCLTAEEMILSAYSRGLVSLQTPFIRGSMAAVGLGYETISTMIPPEIEVACHNARESSTISGPADIVREFVAEITSKGIFAKEVPCSNIAYHSRYIADAGPGLLKYLKEVIKTARPRSNRWVSTSVPKENWNEHLAQYSSAEYHTNNLLCPVLFEETLPEIPNNAVLVEVAPHGLLQAILKRSVPSDCKNIALTRRKHPDNVFLLLESIGKLYMEGYNPKVQILYPKIELPVSTGTPFLSHHVEWAHGEKWAMPFYKTAIRVTAAASNCMVSLHDKENQYLNGHIIEERVVYPYAASLIAVWDTFAMYNNILKKQLSVVFQDVQFHVQPHIQDQSQMTLKVEIQKGTGKFNVLDDNIKIASGCIVIYKKKKGDDTENKPTPMIHANSDLNEKDIYDLLLERNHSYSGEFRSLQRANASLTEAELIWHNNWTTFIDGMLQLNVLRQPHTLVLKPVYIKQISIDVENHKNFIGEEKLDDKVLVKAEVHDQYGYTKCGGIFIEGIRYKAHYPCTLNKEINLGSLQFVQKDDKDIDVAASLLVFLQIMAENLDKQNINIIGVTDYIKEGSIFDALNINDANFIGINVQYQQLPISSLKNSNLINMADAVMVNNLPTDDNICSNLHRLLREDTFVITENDDALDKRTRPSALYRVLSTLSDNRNGQTQLQLVRWKPVPQAPIATAITIRTPSDYALLSSARASIPPKQRLLIFSPYPAPAGLKDVVQAWRKESNRNLIQLVMVSDEGSNLFIDELPEIDLALNVVIQGKWGGEYYVPIKDDTKVSNVMLKTSQVGDYNNLIWTESPDIISDALTVNVHYAAINSVDIKKASGSYIFKKESDNCFGMDFSGVTTSGNRVMGVIPGGAICSQLRLEPEMLWPVPAHWSLEEAATVPLPYLLALYCLGVKTIIVPGLSVLIHGGCGAIGQAAIATALYLRCKVFTTVSDIRKKKFLLDLFPELEECYIGNSRDDSFGDLVLAETGGRGCDVVISNVKPDLKDVSCKCVASSGFIIDLQYFDGEENDSFGLYYLTKERSYSHIQFSSIFKKENQNQFRILHGMLAEGIHRGYVRPLSHITYKSSEVSRAFKLLAASNHRGRVLLHIKDDTPHVSKHRFTCKADQCHLILSNEENLGIQLADRLIERGVSKLHIHCMAYSSAKAQYKIRSWQKANVEVRVSFNNLNTENDVQKLIDSAKLLGPVQGIFSVVGATQKLHESLFKALDLISRKQCPDLRYFAIIHLGNSMSGHTTCISRVNNKLPATLLSLPDLKDVYNPIWRGSLDAIERAVVVPKPVLIARIIPEENQELINQIADISGISLPKDVSMTATLEQLGCLEDRLQSISTFLRVKYNADFNEHQLLHLTLEEILHVERTDHTLEDVKGLGKFFGQVDPDNLQATTQMVFMPTITTGSLMRENEFDMNQTFLSIIPGMEGLYARFFGICERLKLSALVLQPSLDHPNDTIYETARKFTESLMASSAVKNNFYLLGYESGIFIALEMAKILEEYGLTGTVYCIGYAPNELKATIEETLAEYKTKEELQNAVAHHMCTLMTDMDTTSLMKSLQKVTTWPKKLNVCKSFLRGHITHSLQYAVSIIDCALAHIEQARQYITSPYNLRSRLILLRAAHTEPPKFEASLQQYSQQPVIIHQLQAPLARVAKDARCAAIINQYLDPQILDAFEKKNVCDSYLLDPDNFMSIQHDYESVE